MLQSLIDGGMSQVSSVRSTLGCPAPVLFSTDHIPRFCQMLVQQLANVRGHALLFVCGGPHDRPFQSCIHPHHYARRFSHRLTLPCLTGASATTPSLSVRLRSRTLAEAGRAACSLLPVSLRSRSCSVLARPCRATGDDSASRSARAQPRYVERRVIAPQANCEHVFNVNALGLLSHRAEP